MNYKKTVRLDDEEIKVVDEIISYYHDSFGVKLNLSDVMRLGLKKLNEELGGEKNVN